MNTSEWSLVSKPFNILPEPFPEHFTEEEAGVILGGILRTIDLSFKKSDPVPKTILVDFFGPPKSGKTNMTARVEQVFRRHNFNVFCPPETAEIEEIRNSKYSGHPLLFQAKHDAGVQDYILHLAEHPRIHMAIISRGLIDRLYWYARDMRKGLYSQVYYDSVRNHIYEFLRQDLVDAFFFFTCSPEMALQREYSQALTQKRGSNMNEKNLSEALVLYKEVLNDVQKNVPGLPVFYIDTSDLTVQAVGQEVLRFLLPTVCRRFSVPSSAFLPYSATLMHKNAKHAINFEEQLKLKGLPDRRKIEEMGWVYLKSYIQEDTYLDINFGISNNIRAVSEELLRIRKDDGGIRFLYKGPVRDRLLSHRNLQNFYISEKEAEEIQHLYPAILVIVKQRDYFRLNASSFESDGSFFILHIDKVEGLGDFTEIRALGSSDKMHTQELFEMASKLGFGLADVVEENYFTMALRNKSSK